MDTFWRILHHDGNFSAPSPQQNYQGKATFTLRLAPLPFSLAWPVKATSPSCISDLATLHLLFVIYAHNPSCTFWPGKTITTREKGEDGRAQLEISR
jgi:hypothetical protein